MPTAVISLASGTRVTIEGTSEEVAALLERFDGGQPSQEPDHRKRSGTTGARSKATPTNVVHELVDDGFFREPRSLNAVNEALRAQGHFYPITTLSPTLLRLVRGKRLRRLKYSKTWTYVN